jgi:hypothetical protein
MGATAGLLFFPAHAAWMSLHRSASTAESPNRLAPEVPLICPTFAHLDPVNTVET